MAKAIVDKVEDGFEVANIPGKGRGVITRRILNFEQGEFLCEYAGELITCRHGGKEERGHLHA